MPSIVVEPESLTETPGGGPVIAGVQFRRPVKRAVAYPPEQSEQTLANGSTRMYYAGRRMTVSLEFSKLTGDEKAALEAACAAPFVTYQEDAGADPVVVSIDDPPSFDAVGATVPVRHNASLALKARDLIP